MQIHANCYRQQSPLYQSGGSLFIGLNMKVNRNPLPCSSLECHLLQSVCSTGTSKSVTVDVSSSAIQTFLALSLSTLWFSTAEWELHLAWTIWLDGLMDECAGTAPGV